MNGQGARTEVVRVADHHLPALAEFIAQTWDPNASAAGLRKARSFAATENPAAGGQEPPTFLLLSAGRALGHVTTIPIRLWHAGELTPAHWIKGLMVLPEHRNGPVGFMVLKEAVNRLDTALAMVVQPAPRKLFQALGFTDLGALPNHIRILNPAQFARRLDLDGVGLASVPRWVHTALRLAQRSGLASLGGALVAAATGLWLVARTGRTSGLVTHAPAEIDENACDQLWIRSRGQIEAAPARDGSYYRWRYHKSETDRYLAGTVHDDSGLQGIVFVRRPRRNGDPRLAGLRVATLSDLLFPPDRSDVGLALLATAERLARQLGADALLCSASHFAIGPLLRRRAFLRLPGNVHALVRWPNVELAPQLDRWWLTRGDSSADEVF
ncbi:MAG: hypothetical protein JSU87_18155 [Gemmatimonadota bacterium]|nr:MAG: hypothetical protein JSU87_18155 [Gemmatimonadota bacterium]